MSADSTWMLWTRRFWQRTTGCPSCGQEVQRQGEESRRQASRKKAAKKVAAPKAAKPAVDGKTAAAGPDAA
jgi:uncharacterized Zn finger protein (UPF0148 family)